VNCCLGLTAREDEILAQLATGRTNPQILEPSPPGPRTGLPRIRPRRRARRPPTRACSARRSCRRSVTEPSARSRRPRSNSWCRHGRRRTAPAPCAAATPYSQPSSEPPSALISSAEHRAVV